MSAPICGNRFKKSEDNNLHRVDVDKLHGAIRESKKQPSDTHNGTKMPTQVSPQNQCMQHRMAYHKQLQLRNKAASRASIKDLYENREFLRLHVSMTMVQIFMADGMKVRDAARDGGSGGGGGAAGDKK